MRDLRHADLAVTMEIYAKASFERDTRSVERAGGEPGMRSSAELVRSELNGGGTR